MNDDTVKMIVEIYEQQIEQLTKENKYLRQQVYHLQASIDAQIEEDN